MEGDPKCTPQGSAGEEEKPGKRLVVENCGIYMNKMKNAGVVCNRITELNINSRKQVSTTKSDSSQMKDILSHGNDQAMEMHPAKRPLTSYSTYENQNKYFETKLVPDMQGKMSICVGRKSGSATVNISIDEYDLGKTYSTWKKIFDKSSLQNKSNLVNNLFLTVDEDADRSDKLPVIKNRNPPYANPDGPFEKERLDLPKQARDNLDRTLTPLDCADTNSLFKKKNFHTYRDSFLLMRPHGEVLLDEVKGVRRTRFPWAHSNRLKHILSYSYAAGADAMNGDTNYDHTNYDDKNYDHTNYDDKNYDDKNYDDMISSHASNDAPPHFGSHHVNGNREFAGEGGCSSHCHTPNDASKDVFNQQGTCYRAPSLTEIE
ncbi:thioredoxin-like associated protein 1, putative [Plasmodium knowlesi strain H]|uniref:Thioredoxin-like associated protein 1, putative n=3 Tax=Plasmodium knowlesi TaxID=5850 RepID=A0A5K1VG62_PLAKH|nr:thioredoxin-like associated protein 1, putative [Plasmodium knowlesi strain H]OTN64196.1 putative Thioredoxin-like associated protein 1 [Plasmodium knowlesi]CAA9991090.1 thioredoxin-like associated protein 1, putative [Plasmodium knowlesi strain H]SBO20611.1 thioredoxin-like associated protein 1, putative [Plasmodium knowlesi strain H]SBO21016.1 thioredoxin-like associated protein 1, putative [Plasmodium knowlesi strain H]VVS80564.1 thioredoxin-like associated protein 1, putative [Plasmodiu|eukprot:XP_002262373.1 hypothetical protein, conserved in Plasmodium species [Plasmodium knowlesi strain H]